MAQDDGEFWKTDVKTARAEAASKHHSLLLFFRDPIAVDEPPQMRSFPSPASGLSAIAGGVRVGAQDVKALVTDYQIRRFPALVVIGPFGERVKRWEGRWSARDVVRVVTNKHKQIEKRLADLDERVAEAKAALEKREFAAAIKRCGEVVAKSSGGYPQRQQVAAILTKILESAETELAVTLAREGIDSDRTLERSLEKLASTYKGLRSFERRIEREVDRLRGRKIGGS